MTSRLRTVLLGAGTAFLAGALVQTPALAATGLTSGLTSPEVIGHRGARGLWPENTVVGFARAIELGVDEIELDIRRTSDGVLVIAHDAAISAKLCRDTAPAAPGDREWPYVGRLVAELTLAQIETLDCGRRRASDEFTATEQAVPGTRPPTLSAVLHLLARPLTGKTLVRLEIKANPDIDTDADVDRYVRDTVHEVRDLGLSPRSILMSFDWRVLTDAREVASSIPRAALVQPSTAQVGLAGASPWLDGRDVDAHPLAPAQEPQAAQALPPDVAEMAKAQGATMLAVQHTMAATELVARSHELGMPISTWIVNTPDEIGTMIDRGLDGIITDYPDRVRDVLATRGLPTPPAAGPLPLPAPRPMPPPSPLRLSADVGYSSATLSWARPSSASQTLVRMALGAAAPAGVSSGSALYSGASLHVATPSLRPGRGYAFAAFARDVEGWTSAATTVRVLGSRLGGSAPARVQRRIGQLATVTYSGTMRDSNGRPLVGRLVRLLVHPRGTVGWIVADSARTGTDGTVRLYRRAARDLLAQIGFSGGRGVTGGRSPAMTTLVRL